MKAKIEISVRCQIRTGVDHLPPSVEAGDAFQVLFPDKNILWLCSKCFGPLQGAQVVGALTLGCPAILEEDTDEEDTRDEDYE